MELSKLAKIFKALSCEHRIALLEMLRELDTSEACCQGVDRLFTMACEKLNIGKSTVSHHLKELENAGLIDCCRQGQHMNCKLNLKLLEEVKSNL